ncbi:MAG TPA: NADP-dependent isocitrate dehydrogenase, partial [Microbacteriaceae bacterium]|nr:NADP-dependent isocitrate dehydrogenase [Microbacteriaceae bacterium]
QIRHVTKSGTVTVLRQEIPVTAGEIVDGTVMSRAALERFLTEQIARAARENVLFSVQLKATMMKVSDPLIFGSAIRVFFPQVFERWGEALGAAGLNPANGLAGILAGLDAVPEGEKIRAAIHERLTREPAIAMVDSERGITNLHVPSDVIIDASMPAMIRNSGKMWNAAGELQDTLAVIPDSSYAGVYQAVIDDCRAHGAFDPATMGSVPNVGLMAQKAEEYGSHDKTFEIEAAGMVQVVDSAGRVLIEHAVEAGDIWRACQAKDVPIKDWIELAVRRSKVSHTPAVFWLDETRAHDAQLIKKVREHWAEIDTDGLELTIMAPVEATRYSLERIRRGLDTISVTGNVLRDYLTDLFPIMELGTSAKMLSIVPLIAGGGLFETGAGGSAPKHVAQLLKEDHLRWDSLGEFLALASSLDHLAETTGNKRAGILGRALDRATGVLLEKNMSPRRVVGELDNRGSHFFLATQWAKELAAQTDDTALAASFAPLAKKLAAAANVIDAELLGVQGASVDLGGYYRPDEAKTDAVMRPSSTFNDILATLTA